LSVFLPVVKFLVPEFVDCTRRFDIYYLLSRGSCMLYIYWGDF